MPAIAWVAALAMAGLGGPAAASAPPGSARNTAASSASSETSADAYEDAWASRVRPWVRPPVAQVEVEAGGLGDERRDAAGEPEPCASFRPDAREVGAFIARARRISQRDFFHQADWSACHATGVVRFRDGSRATWMVQRLGAGYVEIDGRRHYLHCPRCMLGAGPAKARP